MITTEGKAHIKRYLAGWTPSIAKAMVFGIGNNSELASDTRLHLEVGRSPITVVNYDFAANKLLFKATIPDTFIGKIYEVGLYSLENDPTQLTSRFITTFDSATEYWINPADSTPSVFGSTATRIGADALRHAPAASNTITSSLSNVQLDLSNFAGTDAFTFAYSVADANTNQIVFKFMTDASNHYSFSMGAQTAGYKIVQATKGSATVTGTPSWSNIKEVQVATTAKSGGSTSVEFDAIRLEDRNSTNLDYVLVARKVLPVPETKVDGKPTDIEFSFDVSL